MTKSFWNLKLFSFSLKTQWYLYMLGLSLVSVKGQGVEERVGVKMRNGTGPKWPPNINTGGGGDIVMHEIRAQIW